jgi:Protein of unknown function (DUF2785)
MRTAVVCLLLMPFLAQAGHDKDYWRRIVDAKFEVPAGEAPAKLAAELVTHLGDVDPVMRDDLAFTILTSWIYDKKLLGPDDLRPMMRALERNLSRDPGTTGTDAVLLRSFSALTLSIVAARDNATPFLGDEEFRHLLDSAIAYLRDERDMRGFDAARGWIHTAAHTADLLKFLARSPRLRAGDQSRVLSALLDKQRSGAVFAQGEDERMARVAISIARRGDFDRGVFREWLDAAKAAAAFPKSPTVEALRTQQNVRHLLAALWTEMSVDDRPSEGADAARQMLRETLKELF